MNETFFLDVSVPIEFQTYNVYISYARMLLYLYSVTLCAVPTHTYAYLKVLTIGFTCALSMPMLSYDGSIGIDPALLGSLARRSPSLTGVAYSLRGPAPRQAVNILPYAKHVPCPRTLCAAIGGGGYIQN